MISLFDGKLAVLPLKEWGDDNLPGGWHMTRALWMSHVAFGSADLGFFDDIEFFSRPRKLQRMKDRTGRLIPTRYAILTLDDLILLGMKHL